MTRLVLHIDRLVLSGFARSDTRAITRAIESELADRLAGAAAAGAITTAGDRREVRARRVSVRGEAAPADLGRAVADSIARGIRR